MKRLQLRPRCANGTSSREGSFEVHDGLETMKSSQRTLQALFSETDRWVDARLIAEHGLIGSGSGASGHQRS